MLTIDSEQHIAQAVVALKSADPRLVPLIETTGPLPLRRREDGLAGLMAIVVSQQLSRASADAIHGRLVAMLGELTPAGVAACEDQQFAACGLSRPKIRTLRAIVDAALSGALDFAALREMADDAVGEAMCQVKGIGPWTANIYLLSCLGRADAFPAGDLALQEAARAGLGLDTRPSAAELLAEAELWRPWRAVAARLLWSYYRHIRNEVTGVDREQGGTV